MRRPILILLSIAAFTVIALALARLHGGAHQAVVVVEDTPAPTRSPEPPIVVDVAGAVAHPGVYRLAAGGTLQDVPPRARGGSAGTDARLKIDVNHATAAELEALPGVGPTTAARIVRSRGGRPFGRIEELQTRGRVTPSVCADIKDMVTTLCTRFSERHSSRRRRARCGSRSRCR